MATNATSKIDTAAEKAFAEAAASKAAPKTATPAKRAAPAKPAAKKVVAKTTPTKKATPTAKKAPVKKAAAKKVAPKKTTAKKTPAKPAAKRAPKKASAAATTVNPVSKLKDTIMATAKKTDFTKTAKDMAADVQTRAKTAFAKSGEIAAQVGEFNKDNVEAVVESGKIFFAGVQEISSDQIATGKTVVETVTQDVKKMAAVKSPTELAQLQGELARRNFDAAVSFGSKNTEAWVKLYTDAFAPISSRVSVASEKLSKAA